MDGYHVEDMLALIDADTPVFASALVSEEIDLSLAKSRLDVCISNLIKNSECSEYSLFVSGGHNFRYDIDSTYKANRTGIDPRWREGLRLHLINEWGATECIGFEADDMCGIKQKEDGSTCIVAIDKDLLQVPGLHYSWPIIRKGVVVREGIFQEISKEEGMRRFFTQALTGDTSDNIKGIRGIGPAKAAKILEDCHTEEELYNSVYEAYRTRIWMDDDATEETETERFERNLNLLWIWRELGVTYTIRKEMYG